MDTVARAKLPWSKTARLDIVGAEHTVGRLVNVVPGTVRSSSGEFVSASCAIKVDGKTVVSKKGARAKPTICDYKLK